MRRRQRAGRRTGSTSRKPARRHQATGVSARRPIAGDGELTGQVYGGTRELYNPQTFAIVRVDRHQQGAAARLTLPWRIDSVENRFSVGVDAQWLSDLRMNWANCNGVSAVSATCPALAVEGTIARPEGTRVEHRSVRARRGGARPVPRQRRCAARTRCASTLPITISATGRNDSGDRTMKAVSLMFGATGAPLPSTRCTRAWDRRSRRPPRRSSQLPTDRRVSTATSSRSSRRRTRSERRPRRSPGAVRRLDLRHRSARRADSVPDSERQRPHYYRNAGRTRRQGVELELLTDAGPVTLTGAYAYSHFRFRDFERRRSVRRQDHSGIPEQQWQAAATWHVPRALLVADVQSKSQVFVNDANAAAAPSFAVVDARVVGIAAFGKPWLSPVVGVQNLFDRKYIGSVAINATGASLAATKFYEPSPRRTWIIGLSAATNPW